MSQGPTQSPIPGSSTEPNKSSDTLTVLVFKDNYAARTFTIPLQWISRLGALLGIMVGVTTICTFVSIKYYRIAARADLDRVQDLEQELTDLRANLKNWEAKSSETTGSSSSTVAISGASTPNLVESSVSVSNHSNSSSTSPSQLATHGDVRIFTSFPSSFALRTPDPSSLPFVIQPPKVSWRGKTLNVKFALQYTKPDQGSQEGKILILARGPESLLSYPANSMTPLGADHLLSTLKGESFAVSRFREVKAEFGPLRSLDSIQNIEIFIADSKGQLLIYKNIETSKLKSSPEIVPQTSTSTPPPNLLPKDAPAESESTSSP